MHPACNFLLPLSSRHLDPQSPPRPFTLQVAEPQWSETFATLPTGQKPMGARPKLTAALHSCAVVRDGRPSASLKMCTVYSIHT